MQSDQGLDRTVAYGSAFQKSGPSGPHVGRQFRNFDRMMHLLVNMPKSWDHAVHARDLEPMPLYPSMQINSVSLALHEMEHVLQEEVCNPQIRLLNVTKCTNRIMRFDGLLPTLILKGPRLMICV